MEADGTARRKRLSGTPGDGLRAAFADRKGVAHAQTASCRAFCGGTERRLRRLRWDVLVLPTCLVSTSSRSPLLVRRLHRWPHRVLPRRLIRGRGSPEALSPLCPVSGTSGH